MMLDVMQYAPPAAVDPWTQQAYNYYMSNVGPKRTAKINAYGGDLDARLQYALGLGHDDELAMYNTWLQNNPKPAATTPTAATPAEEAVVIDPAKMALAKKAAMDRAELQLRAQGLDPALYMEQIAAQYDKAAETASLQKDPYSVYSDDIATSVVQAENNRRQQEFMNQFEAQTGYSADRAALPTTMLDDAINSILGEQQKAAQLQLERGKARGIYNDVGYNAGQEAINTAAGTGRSELGSLGGSLLDQYMGNLNAIDDKAFNAYQSFPIGSSSFNLDPYMQERNDYLTRVKGNAAGDLRGALGGKNFFDFGKIGQASGTAQGALNLRDADVATALNERKRLNTMNRGLGSQGAF